MNRYHPFYTPIQRPQTPVWPPVNPYYARHRHPHDFPPVQPKQFMESADKMVPLLDDAEKIMDKVSHSKEFSTRLMSAAQQSNMNEVHQIIRSVGIKSSPSIRFNPDGFTLEFSNKTGDLDCCHLTITLRWK